MSDALFGRLGEFRARGMASPPVRRLLRGWDRVVEIRAQGGGALFLSSRGGVMEGPAERAERPPDVVISGAAPVLEAVFGGELNPARAHLDGDLEVAGSQRDQLVLDSLVMLIWGL